MSIRIQTSRNDENSEIQTQKRFFKSNLRFVPTSCPRICLRSLGQLHQARKENLEKIQIEAARIVTGITRSASINNMYKEIGWLTLENRRKYKKLILIYKIINGLTPDYLHEIFPRNVSTRTIYSLRNIHQIDSIACRTELLARSFIPSAVSLWNELPDDVKSLQSLSSLVVYIRES